MHPVHKRNKILGILFFIWTASREKKMSLLAKLYNAVFIYSLTACNWNVSILEKSQNVLTWQSRGIIEGNG